MPYVITTTTPCGDCKLCDRRLTAAGTRGSSDCPHRDVTERQLPAVATLDEAQQAAADLVGERCAEHYAGHDWTGRKETMTALLDAAFHLPEEGGTITLPDGTVIEVN